MHIDTCSSLTSLAVVFLHLALDTRATHSQSINSHTFCINTNHSQLICTSLMSAAPIEPVVVAAASSSASAVPSSEADVAAAAAAAARVAAFEQELRAAIVRLVALDAEDAALWKLIDDAHGVKIYSKEVNQQQRV